jgi:hypothetical protein
MQTNIAMTPKVIVNIRTDCEELISNVRFQPRAILIKTEINDRELQKFINKTGDKYDE